MPAVLEHRFVRGDEASLRELYEDVGSAVYTFCLRRLNDPQAAQDVAQEVFVSAWKGRSGFDPSRGSLPAWVMGIAKNRLIDHQRRQARAAEEALDSAAVEDGSDDEIDRLGDRLMVARALERLGPRRRQVIELAYLADLTHDQVAERTGIPLGTVKSDIRRGLAQIRAELGAHDG